VEGELIMAMSRKWVNEINREIRNGETERRHNSLLADKKKELDSHSIKIEMVVCVLWECLSEMGVTQEELNSKIREIEERGWTINPPSYYRLCPKCGKKVFDYTERAFEGTCMYCGQTVNMYPGDIEE